MTAPLHDEIRERPDRLAMRSVRRSARHLYTLVWRRVSEPAEAFSWRYGPHFLPAWVEETI